MDIMNIGVAARVRGERARNAAGRFNVTYRTGYIVDGVVPGQGNFGLS